MCFVFQRKKNFFSLTGQSCCWRRWVGWARQHLGNLYTEKWVICVVPTYVWHLLRWDWCLWCQPRVNRHLASFIARDCSLSRVASSGWVIMLKNAFNFDFCTFLLLHAHILFLFDSEKAQQLNSLSLSFSCFFIWLYVPQAWAYKAGLGQACMWP